MVVMSLVLDSTAHEDILVHVESCQVGGFDAPFSGGASVLSNWEAGRVPYVRRSREEAAKGRSGHRGARRKVLTSVIDTVGMKVQSRRTSAGPLGFQALFRLRPSDNPSDAMVLNCRRMGGMLGR